MYQNQNWSTDVSLARFGGIREFRFAWRSLGAGLLVSALVAAYALQHSAAPATPAAKPAVAEPMKKPAPVPDETFVTPPGATAELFVAWTAGDSLSELLERAGVGKSDATRAAQLVARALPAGVPEGTEIAILVGETIANDERQLSRLSFTPSPAFKITIGRTPSGELKLARDALVVDAKPRKFSGRAGSDLFWSMRAAGVPAGSAREFLEALARRMNPRSIAPNDRFELVVDHMRTSNGESRAGPLLYASLNRNGRGGLTLVRWTVAGQTALFEPGKPVQDVGGLAKPVNGSISSRFGHRIHPILRFMRLHSGVDFRAGWGTPVIAAADGIVGAAGWAGGYGQQVRVTHLNGVATSYSHLSGVAVERGMRVRRGDVIGFVGSSGLSTGSHLHFEVRQYGRPVDPLSFKFEPPPISASELAALSARADQLRGV
ncbi:MAG: M23 family metallopeptidase [Alphaproteobacteria bacterium]